ncbi:hypothetical protein D3C76_1295710 [compost metagenome]
MPVIKAVARPNISGLRLVKAALHKVSRMAIRISQLPTVRPTLPERPTKVASKGDAPSPDCMVRQIPRVSIKIPQMNRRAVLRRELVILEQQKFL